MAPRLRLSPLNWRGTCTTGIRVCGERRRIQKGYAMTTEIKPKEPLREELERLETSLDTPPVPGELANWASMLRKNVDVAAAAILHQIETVHPEQISEIEGQDLELQGRTRQSARDRHREHGLV